MSFDPEKMNKLPPAARFFDVNDLWYFSNRWAVRRLYSLPITANQITGLSLIIGVVASGFYFWGSTYGAFIGAGFLYGKIYLDNVDGNLARVRGEVSRLGRFFDSLTDFAVTTLVYAGITTRLVRETGEESLWVLGSLALLSCLIHCSYFVYYLVSYTSFTGVYNKNRVNEEITSADMEALSKGDLSSGILTLQRLHGWIYGWQDRLIEGLDRASRKGAGLGDSDADRNCWYADKLFLTLSSPLCLCTNNMVLVAFSLLGQLELFFFLIIFLGNAYLAGLQGWKIIRHRKGVKTAME